MKGDVDWMSWYCRTCNKRNMGDWEAEQCIRKKHDIRQSIPMSEWQKEHAKQFRETHTWPRGTRAKLQRRDGKGCAICGSMIRLSIHHHIHAKENPHRNSDGSAKYDLGLLVCLCGSCHGKTHTAHPDTPFMRTLDGVMKRAKTVSLHNKAEK